MLSAVTLLFTTQGRGDYMYVGQCVCDKETEIECLFVNEIFFLTLLLSLGSMCNVSK